MVFYIMIEKTVVVKNKAGIHCRPSSAIISAVEEFPGATFNIKSEKGETDLSSILGLLSLAILYGEKVTIQADGEDSEKACSKIAALFEYEFDFPQN